MPIPEIPSLEHDGSQEESLISGPSISETNINDPQFRVLGKREAISEIESSHQGQQIGRAAIESFRISRALNSSKFKKVMATLLSVAGLASPFVNAASASAASHIEVVQTNSNLTQHMTTDNSRTFGREHRMAHIPVISVNDSERFQTFAGVGAAMTDSSAWLLSRLSAGVRYRAMKDLFTTSGIDMNDVRVPMAASDYTVSPEPYTYDDIPKGQTDPRLSHFSIGHDRSYVLPMLRQAEGLNPHLWKIANPWTLPAFMKANDSLNNVNRSGLLLPAMYPTAAEYFVKFLEAYKKAGVAIDAVTPENEPTDPAKYPGMSLPPYAEANFITNDLEPALSNAHLSVEIFGNDLSPNRQDYVYGLLKDKPNPLAGIAWHAYAGSPEKVKKFVSPNLTQILNEWSPEHSAYPTGEQAIEWLNSDVSSLITWNLALDPNGGPVEPINGCYQCTGLITVNPSIDKVSFGQKYYELAQIGHFIKPGAVRIGSNHYVQYSHDSTRISGGLDDTAFLNPNGSKVLVAFNNSSHWMRFAVEYHNNEFEDNIAPDAMKTYTWR